MNISILIVTYNHEKYIEECLESIYFQQATYNADRKHRLQVVVTDDCSKDSTREIVKKWVQLNGDKFDGFELVEAESNEGTCRNYIKGLKACIGDYIKVIGGDDLFCRNSIFEFLKYLDEYDVVYGLPLTYIENGKNDAQKIAKELLECHFIYKEEENINYFDLIHRYCFLNAPGTCFRKELQLDEENLGMMLEYKYLDDYPQYLKISEIKDIRKKYVPEIVVIYRRTSDSTYIRTPKQLRDELIRVFKYAKETSHRTREKVIQTCSIYMQKIEHPVKYLDLLTYIHKYYLFKHRKDDSVIFLDDVEKNLAYVSLLKQRCL